MASAGLVLRCAALLAITVLTYLAIGFGDYFVASIPGALGIAIPQDALFAWLQSSLLLFSAFLVCVFFTVPALLLLVGHAGAWVRSVILRAGKAILAAFGLFAVAYTGAAAGLSVRLPLPAFGNNPVQEAIGVVLVLVVIAALFFGEGLARLASAPLSFARGTRMSSRAAIELTQVPVGHLRVKQKEENAKGEALRIQRFLQTWAGLDGSCELSIEFHEGRGRILLSASGHGSCERLEKRLVSAARTSFPEFRVVPSPAPTASGDTAQSVLSLRGVPEPHENPLEPLTRYFLENGCEGGYRVRIRKAGSNPVSRRLAARKQRELAKRTEGQHSESRLLESQESVSKKDYASSIELEESIRDYERKVSAFALKVSAEVVGYGSSDEAAESVATGAAGVLKGTLSNHRMKTALRVSRGTRDRGTLMLPAEAVPYFWIPQVAIGTEIAPSAEFELPPAFKGEVELGTIASQSGITGHPARMPIDDLRKHILIAGMTGGGKTTTCFNILLQLYQHGVPFLVIEPVKNEYRSLLAVIPGLQVFTLGDEETAPFRLNVFEPPEGVRVQTHLENLTAAWNASFVMYSPTQYVIKEVVEWTYRACGWSLKLNRRGSPIALSDLRRQAGLVAGRLGYEPNVTMDIEAALRTRITSLTLGGKGPMFDTLASIPVETLLRRPTVIELRNVPNDEEKAFVTALLLGNIVEYLEARGSSKHLAHLTLIEEAHRLLPNLSAGKGDPEGADPRKRMVEQFANMLAELRAYGEGLAIVEQIPTKILPDAIKNTATKIVHRVPAADDREVLAGAMNMTGEQSAVLTGLKPGEAVLSVERHPLPIRIVAANPTGKLGIPLGEISDGEVKRHMAEFYLRNPLPKPPPERHDEELLELVDAEWFGEKFALAYGKWQDSGDAGPLATLVTESARRFARNEEEVLEVSEHLLELAGLLYLPFDAADRARFPRLFIRRVERSRRDGRRE